MGLPAGLFETARLKGVRHFSQCNTSQDLFSAKEKEGTKMPEEYADARPRKNFFIQMFTKDISLEECIMDLIDNSIDGLVRSRGLKLAAISKSIFAKNGNTKRTEQDLPTVRVSYSKKAVEISDNCGGIDLEYARTEAFNFGHGPEGRKGLVGVYGVGLKRALFKIGDEFRVESRTVDNGFSCHLIVSEWLKKDSSLEDWRVPLEATGKAKGPKEAGTTIQITNLHEEVQMRLEGGTIDTTLYRSVSRSFSFFLDKYVRIILNGKVVKPFRIPLGQPTAGKASVEEFDQDGVRVRIIATIAEKDEKGRYDQDLAGWYVACNGRMVLDANKTTTSGWGRLGRMPTFQPKYRSFIGIVFFEAEDPLLLPWTTNKRDLNKESMIYLRVRNRMMAAARPVLSFLNRQYPSERGEEPIEREISRKVERVSLGDLVSRKGTVFEVPPTARKVKTTTRVQYDAKNEDLEKIRKHLRKPSMGANRIGEHTFQYFVKQEGLS